MHILIGCHAVFPFLYVVPVIHPPTSSRWWGSGSQGHHRGCLEKHIRAAAQDLPDRALWVQALEPVLSWPFQGSGLSTLAPLPPLGGLMQTGESSGSCARFSAPEEKRQTDGCPWRAEIFRHNRIGGVISAGENLLV